MKIGESKVTPDGLVSVPAEVLRRLDAQPGAVLEWHDDGGCIVVRVAKKLTSLDIHRRLFPDGPPPARTVEEMDQGIAEAVKARFERCRRRAAPDGTHDGAEARWSSPTLAARCSSP